MKTSAMTPAQMAQQHNRDEEGQYKVGLNSEPEGVLTGLPEVDEMDLSDQTPVEIDTQLEKLYTDKYRALNDIDKAMDRMLTVVQPDHWSRKVVTLKNTEVLIEAHRLIEDPATDAYKVRSLTDLLAKVKAGEDEVDQIEAEEETLEEEYVRRGRWTRAFLVSNTNGHVHSSMHCSSCFPTTRYAWMTEYSGGTEQSVVGDAGERACTLCYPSAPIDVLKRPTKMFSEDEKQAQREREERAAAKVERDAKKLAKAVLPSGEPLRIPTWTDNKGNQHYDDFQSLVSARTRLTDLQEDWRQNESEADRVAKGMLSEAIAAKEGKTVDVVLAEAKIRAAKRK